MTANVDQAQHQDAATQESVINAHDPPNPATDSVAVDATAIAHSAPVLPNLSSLPAAGQLISHDDTIYTTVKEGLAYILVPPNAKKLNDPKEASTKNKRAKGEKNEEHQTNQSVFYNEIMQYNRDLSVLAIRAYGEDRTERLRLRAEKKQKAVREARERAEAKTKDKEALKSDLRDEYESKAATTSEIEDKSVQTASESGLVSNGLKRSHDEMDSGDALSQQAAKRLKENARDVQRHESAQSATIRGSTTALTSEAPTNSLINAGEGPKVINPDAPSKDRRNPRFKVLDALSATGLRALRYASELPFVDSVVANDLSAKATRMILANVKHNNLQDKITAVTGNAITHMYQFVGQEHRGGPGKQYDVIDLDPYGTAVPFLDAAVQALADGGLLCVTCTDTAVFMSNGYPEKAFSLYGGTTVKGQCAHEGGLRLMLHAIATAAAKYGIAIEPLLSLSIDYYARVFVTVRKSPADVKFLMSKTMTLNHCDNGCFSITPQWLGRSTSTQDRKGNLLWKHGYNAPDAGAFCKHCGFKTHVNGPMWGGPPDNPHFIDRILGYLPNINRSTYPTHDRIEGMLTTALEELQIFPQKETKPQVTSTASGQEPPASANLIDPVPPEVRDVHPFYVFPSSLAKVLHCIAPSENQVKGALRHAGFKASRTHAARGGIKTDAPPSAIWHIMREWVRTKAPIKPGALKEGMAGWKIMYGHDPTKWPQPDGEEDENNVQGNGHAAQADASAGAPPYEEAESGNASARDGAGAVTANGTSLDSVDGSGATNEAGFKVIFDEELGKDAGKKLKRFQLNPRANWGPMARAK